MKTKIYVLSEPNGPIRYVGKTIKSLSNRLSQHLSVARHGHKNHKYDWLRSMKLVVDIDLVAEVPGDGCREETELIAGLRKLGIRLVNGTTGGEGATGYHHTPEARAKISAALKVRVRRPLSAKALLNYSIAQRGKRRAPFSALTRSRMSAAQKGRVHSVKTLKKMSAAKIGKKFTAERRAAMSKARQTITPSEITLIQTLRAEGWTHRRIAVALGICHATVGVYLRRNGSK
jgi:hypothetical protein